MVIIPYKSKGGLEDYGSRAGYTARQQLAPRGAKLSQGKNVMTVQAAKPYHTDATTRVAAVRLRRAAGGAWRGGGWR